MNYSMREFLHTLRIHWWQKGCAMGNVANIRSVSEQDRYSFTKCWFCSKEKKGSRNYFNKISLMRTTKERMKQVKDILALVAPYIAKPSKNVKIPKGTIVIK